MKRQKKIGYKSSEKIGYETLILHNSSEKESKDFTHQLRVMSYSAADSGVEVAYMTKDMTHQDYPQHNFAHAGLRFQTKKSVQVRDTRISGRSRKEGLALCASML